MSDWVRFGEIFAVLFSQSHALYLGNLCMQRIREQKYNTYSEDRTVSLKKVTDFEEMPLEKLIVNQS